MSADDCKNTTIEQVYSDDPSINDLLTNVVGEVRSFAEAQVSHIHELVKIGLALSAEKNLDRLLEMIVSEARRFTNADGGTLYIKREGEEVLEFSIVQNDTLRVRMGGTGEKISWPPIPLLDKNGGANERNVSAYCALHGTAINIADVYCADGFDFQGTKEFDKTTGYRSKSMLVIPMRDHEDEVIGVLQLLNAKDRRSNEVLGFPAHEIKIITSLASTAAVAINNVRLIQDLEDLLNAFVKSIASAIDAKSPYTAGHILRVASLTGRIVDELNRTDGRYKGIRFTSDEAAEIRLAAWLHDVGKISTPEHIVDKSTKLQTIFDRIELIRHRMEILKRDIEINNLKKQLGMTDEDATLSDSGVDLANLEQGLAFLESVNIGGEFLKDESVNRIKELAGLSCRINGKTVPLLNEDEMINLLIRKGTLSDKERDIINNHVNVGIKMLESLPFPKKMRQVPQYAGMHHEKLDGGGYPRGLTQEEIPVQARILAVADVFEALTAADRPYKEGKRLSESMRILGFMVKDRHLDGDLCDFVVESGLIEEYARQYLSEKQLDDFEWKGRKYSFSRV